MPAPIRKVISVEKAKAKRGIVLTLECGHVLPRVKKLRNDSVFCPLCPEQWTSTYSSCRQCGSVTSPPRTNGICVMCCCRNKKPDGNWDDSKRTIRRFSVDDALFHSWTENSAYLLGVLHADGHIPDKAKTRSNNICIAISEKDLSRLKQLAELLDFTGNIHTWDVVDNYAPRRGVRFTFVSYHIYDRLAELEIKTANVIDHVPERVMHAFVRGFFDGDGSVYLEKQSGKIRASFVGEDDFLLKLRTVLHENVGMSEKLKIHQKTNSDKCWQLSYSYGDACRLYRYMYKTDGCRLERKKLKFETEKGGVPFPTSL